MSKPHFSSSPNDHSSLGHAPPESSFTCLHCGAVVSQQAPGTRHRNHCPQCLWSQHLDITPGDRKSRCQGKMRPIAVAIDSCGEWSLLHQCVRCGTIKMNRIAGDDDEFRLLAVAAKPLARPPFPLEMPHEP